MAEQSINIDRMEHAVALFGSFDENIKLIESEYQVKVLSRGNELKVAGDVEQVAKAVRVIDSLLTLLNRGELLSEQNVRYCIFLVRHQRDFRGHTLKTNVTAIVLTRTNRIENPIVGCTQILTAV